MTMSESYKVPTVEANDTLSSYSEKLSKNLSEKIFGMDHISSANAINIDKLYMNSDKNKDTFALMVDMLCAIMDKKNISSDSFMTKFKEINTKHNTKLKEKYPYS